MRISSRHGSHPVKQLQRDEPSPYAVAHTALSPMAIVDFVEGTQDFCAERALIGINFASRLTEARSAVNTLLTPFVAVIGAFTMSTQLISQFNQP